MFMYIILSVCKSLCIKSKCFWATAKPKHILNNIDLNSLVLFHTLPSSSGSLTNNKFRNVHSRLL